MLLQKEKYQHVRGESEFWTSDGPNHRFSNHPTETLIMPDFAEDFLMGYRMDLTREIGSFEPVSIRPRTKF